MKRVLVVNHSHSVVCGIHDLGKRIYGCLMHSNDLGVSYADCSTETEYRAAVALYNPGAVIVNYRADLTPWATAPVDATTFAVLHQYEEATADIHAAELLRYFDHVLVLDPGLHPSDSRVHAVGRPIPLADETTPPAIPKWLQEIGSFGFAFPHKGFAAVAAEIADQCHNAEFNLHMPEAFFNGTNGQPLYTDGIIAACLEALAKPEFLLNHTSDHIGERGLVARLSLNDVNCLLYVPGQLDAGLSSALDYLIAARRPMLLSKADMFRVVPDVPRWPDARLGDILADYDKYQQQADELYESMAGQFVRDIEKIVAEL